MMFTNKKYNVNNKGIALIVVLILSAIALALVAATLSMVKSSTQISGAYTSYQSSLEAAKGGVDLALAKLLSIPCDNTTMSGSLSLEYNKLGKYDISADVLKKYYYVTVNSTTGAMLNHCIYAIEVKASETDSKNKSIIDVVVKVD